VSDFAQQSDRLQPAEDLLDSFAHSLADAVARGVSGPTVNRAPAVRGVLRHMGSHRQIPGLRDKVPGVISLVGSKRPAVPIRQRSQHLQRGLPLRTAMRLSHSRIHHQAVAVLHQDMAQVRQLGGLAPALVLQPRLRIRRGLMSLVRTGLPMKIYCRVAGIVGWLRRRRLCPAEALLAGPGLDQRAVHGEVLARQQTLLAGLLQHPGEEGLGHLSFQQAVPILGKDRRHPNRIAMPRPTSQRNRRL